MRRACTPLQFAATGMAAALFFWMYLATAPLEHSTAAGAFGPSTPELVASARSFGYEWRHGQTGWPIYVPGFFVAGLTALWISRRCARRLMLLAGAAILVGWLVAVAFAPLGAHWVADKFASREHLVVVASVSHANPLSVYPAAATFIAWSLLVICAAKAVRTGRWALLLLAAGAYIVVAGIRGTFAFGELARTWFGRAAEGDFTALGSLVAAAVITSAFVARERFFRPRAASSAEQQSRIQLPTA